MNLRSSFLRLFEDFIAAGNKAVIALAQSMYVNDLLGVHPRPGDVRMLDDRQHLVVGVTEQTAWLTDGRRLEVISCC